MESNTHDDIFLQAMQQEESQNTGQENGPLKKGKVVSVSETDVFLDMGSKAEVLVALDEFTEKPTVGEEVYVVLKSMVDGVQRGSKKGAEKLAKAEEIRKAYEEEMPVKGAIRSVIVKEERPRGFIVEIGPDINAFLPLSHIDTRKVEDLNELIGKSFDFAIIEAKRNNYTVSRKEYNRKMRKKLFGVFFENHAVGDVLHGSIEEIDQNYLILNVEGVKAFLHISDFSWKFLTDLKKVVKIGDEMDVQIIQLDKSRDSIKVSKKLLMADPWEEIESRYNLGDIINAKVVRFRKDGAMIEVEDGIEAYLHVNEMSWTQKVRDPRKILKRGMLVEVKVKNVNAENRRMEVSLRDLQENPWVNAKDEYSVGRKLTGVISSIFDFGMFVKFEDGIEGLLRSEDVDWLKKDLNLKESYKKGDSIEVIVISMDAGKEKLRLGIKQMSDNPMKTFSMNYPKGAPIEAEVIRVQENGLFVGLQDNLEGFIHISNLDKNNVDDPKEIANVGDKIKAVIKFVDFNKAKIELSRKDYLYQEEKLEVQKYIVNPTKENDNSMTMGSLLKDQFAGITASDSKKTKKKTTTKKTTKKAVKEEEKVEDKTEETPAPTENTEE